MHAPTRILLVDDHAVVRTGFKTLLENQADLRVVCEADSGEQACRQFVDHAPDVVIMDLSLPGIGGLEAIRRIVSREAGARVSLVLMATVGGMALGGWMSGEIHDLTGSYTAAFLNGIAFNLVNMAVAFWLLMGRRRTRSLSPA